MGVDVGRPALRTGERGNITIKEVGHRKWRARCYYRDSTGAKRELTAHASTKGRAENALKGKWHETSKDIITGRHGGGKLTVGDLVERWYSEMLKISRVNGKPKERTLVHQKRMLDKHLIPRIGELSCDELTVGRLNSVIADIVAEDGSGKATAVMTRSKLIHICGYAVDNDILPYNMGRETRVLAYSPASPHTLDAEEIHQLRSAFKQFAAEVKNTRVPLLNTLDLMLATGCRIGEILGLKWEHVHLDDDIPWVEIRHSVAFEAGKGVFLDETKSKKVLRIALPEFAVDVLGSIPRVSDYVFCSRGGKLYASTTIRGSAIRAMRRYGLTIDVFGTGFKSHSLRKTAITAVERDYGLAAASQQGGHSNESITKKFYVAPNVKTIDYTDSLQKLVEMDTPVLAEDTKTVAMTPPHTPSNPVEAMPPAPETLVA